MNMIFYPVVHARQGSHHGLGTYALSAYTADSSSVNSVVKHWESWTLAGVVSTFLTKLSSSQFEMNFKAVGGFYFTCTVFFTDIGGFVILGIVGVFAFLRSFVFSFNDTGIDDADTAR